jgi:hypothetical protein
VFSSSPPQSYPDQLITLILHSPSTYSLIFSVMFTILAVFGHAVKPHICSVEERNFDVEFGLKCDIKAV